MPITALDQNTVKILKTSQVITSVSYAVKELVENSIDADARNIEVNLYDDGLTQIEVKDDGSGIFKEDAPFMALASYTSKINNFEDLENLHMYGFRGEALQALSQVADVKIITKTENQEAATSYVLDSNGNITNSEPSHRSVGTTVQVNGLFKKMPVRRQSLLQSRRMNQDLKYLETLLKGFGIVQPFLRITYRRNKKLIFIKLSASSLVESIKNLLGKDVVSNLELIEEQWPEGKIQLLLPKKNLQDPTIICQSGYQYVFANRRILIHKELEKLINKRIQEYYVNKEALHSKKCIFFLNITVEPSHLDINIEPNKTKGFFKDEKDFIKSIDNILMTFYQLKESPEEKSDNEESYKSDEENDKTELDDEENEWPACKKRKINSIERESREHIVNPLETTQSSDYSNHKENIPPKQGRKVSMAADVRGSVGKELDSNTDDETIFGNRNCSTESKKINEQLEDSDILNFNEIQNQSEDNNRTEAEISSSTVETLSQLPVVDLGEDFPSQVIKDKFNQMLKPNEFISNNDNTESLLSDLDLSEDFAFNKNSGESKSTPRQSTLSFNTSVKGELLLEVDRSNASKVVSNPPSPNSWSRGRVPGLQAGSDVKVFESEFSEKELKPNSLTGFNIFFSQVRPQLVKENPEMSVPQIASLLTDRWKEMAMEEKTHYRELASEKIKQQEVLQKKSKTEKDVSAKSRKKILDFLRSAKNKEGDNKNSRTLRTRTTTEMATNIKKITEKFYRTQSKKKNVVVGPIKPSLWIIKVANQFLVLDVAEMFKKLNFLEHSPNETNAETLEILLKRWMTEKEDMSIMHIIDNKS